MRVRSRFDIISGCGETTSYGRHSQSERESRGAVEWSRMKKAISSCRSFIRRELLAMTTTGVFKRSASRAIPYPSALPYRSDQRVVSVKAEFCLNSSGNARIGQGLLGHDEVMDSILMKPPCLNILLDRRHAGV